MYEPTLFCFVVSSAEEQVVARSVIQGVRRRLPGILTYSSAFEKRASAVQFSIKHIQQVRKDEVHIDNVIDVPTLWTHPQNTSQAEWVSNLRNDYNWRAVVVPICGTLTHQVSKQILGGFDDYFRQRFINKELWSYDCIGVWHKDNAVMESIGEYALELWITKDSPNWQYALENVLVAWVLSGIRAQIMHHAIQTTQHVWYVGAGSQVLDSAFITEQIIDYQKTDILDQLVRPEVTLEYADASMQLANSYLKRYKEEYVAQFRRVITNVESNINFEYTGTDNSVDEYFVWQKTSKYVTNLCGTRWEWWMVDKPGSMARLLSLFGLLRIQQDRDVVPLQGEFVTQARDLLRFVDQSAKGSAEVLDTTFHSFMADAYADEKSGPGLAPLQNKIHDLHTRLYALDMFRYGATQSVERLPYITVELMDDLARDLYQSFTQSVRQIRHRREQVYSFVGVLIRLMIAIPLLNGVVSGFFPPIWSDAMLSIMPTLLLLVGSSLALYSYKQYQRYALKVRKDFVHGKLGGVLKSIMKYRFDEVRQNHVQRLEIIDTSMSKILSVLRDNEDMALRELGVRLPRTTLERGLQIVNDVDKNRVLIRKHEAVEGIDKVLVTEQPVMSEVLRGLTGLRAWMFEYSPKQWQPALVSIATSRLNLLAKDQHVSTGANLYLKMLLDKLSRYDGLVPLSAREYVAELDTIVRLEVIRMLDDVRYVDLQVFLSVDAPYGGRNRLQWLYNVATPATDRFMELDITKQHVYLCLHSSSVGTMRGLSTMHEDGEQRSFTFEVGSHQVNALGVVLGTNDEITCVRLYPVQMPHSNSKE